MKPVIIIAIAFVLLIPISIFAQDSQNIFDEASQQATIESIERFGIDGTIIQTSEFDGIYEAIVMIKDNENELVITYFEIEDGYVKAHNLGVEGQLYSIDSIIGAELFETIFDCYDCVDGPKISPFDCFGQLQFDSDQHNFGKLQCGEDSFPFEATWIATLDEQIESETQNQGGGPLSTEPPIDFINCESLLSERELKSVIEYTGKLNVNSYALDPTKTAPPPFEKGCSITFQTLDGFHSLTMSVFVYETEWQASTQYGSSLFGHAIHNYIIEGESETGWKFFYGEVFSNQQQNWLGSQKDVYRLTVAAPFSNGNIADLSQIQKVAEIAWNKLDEIAEEETMMDETAEEETMMDEKEGGGCLIATATFGSELAPQVQQLREIRDNSLLQTESGRSFMESFNDFYYSFSPYIADYERENPVFKEVVKITITPLLSSLSLLNYVDMNSESAVLGFGMSLILLNIGMYFVLPVFVIHRIRKFV